MRFDPDALLVCHFIDNFELDTAKIVRVILIDDISCIFNLTINLLNPGQIPRQNSMCLVCWVWSTRNNDIVMKLWRLISFTRQRHLNYGPFSDITFSVYNLFALRSVVDSIKGLLRLISENTDMLLCDFFLLDLFDSLFIELQFKINFFLI